MGSGMRCFLEAVFIFLPENRAGGGGGGGGGGIRPLFALFLV